MSPRTVPRRVRVMSAIVGVFLVAIFFLLKLVGPYTDWLWFRELGQTSVFFAVLRIRVVLFLAAAVLVGGAVFASLWFAYRSRPMFIPVSAESPIARYRAVVESAVRTFGAGLPIVIGVLTGFLVQINWPVVELYLHGSSFGTQDPQFHNDISFYVFDLPFYVFALDTLEVVAVVCFAANLITHYLFDGVRPSRAGGMLTRAARVQLASIAGVFFLLKAVGYWFDQYELLFSTRVERVFNGASYTDVTAVLPAKLILTAIAMICAAAFFSAIVLRDLRIPALATALMLLSSVLVGAAWPATVQWLTATPNAKEVERIYIDRNIKATQQAFNLTDQYVKTEDWSPPQDKNTFAQSVQNDKNTLNNLRILDPNLLSPTFTQQQRRRTFYSFPAQLALDRYTVDDQLRDYVVAVRELAPANLTGNQASWQNRHMVFTHGNGFVAAPANQVTQTGQPGSSDQKANGASQGGFPVFVSSDTGNIADPNVPEALRVIQPRVYFGEIIGTADPDYAIVGGPAQEYDADKAAPFSYDGRGGVPVDSMANRLAFMVKFRELNFLRSDQITGQSKLIFVRDPRARVAKVAPWLTLDEKAYPAVVGGRIQWIVDGYTTLSQFPYSKPVSLRDATLDSLDAGGNAAARREQLTGQISYIRNSVKATVDAYDGTVALYQQDDKDPVLKAWMGIFPGLVKAKSSIPPQLAAHFHYPEDLFKVQRALLTKYHVDKSDTFFEGSEQWSVPVDPTQASGQLANQASQPPYYVVATDPNHPGQASFQLTTVMTPQNQPYLSSYISVACDPDDYGRITVRQLSNKGGQISGPSNVYGRLRTTDSVNQAITLLGSADIRYGNLLTVPVGDGGLLYLEPIYTQAKNQESAFPTLARVYVSFDDKVGFDTKLQNALQEALRQADINVDLSAVITPQQQQAPSQHAPPQQQQPPSSGVSQTKQEARTRLQSLGQQVDAAQKTLEAARGAVDAAKGRLADAEKSGDFARIGQALADQQKAVEGYREAVQAYQNAVGAFREGVDDLASAPN